jgi:predicted peptidase
MISLTSAAQDLSIFQKRIYVVGRDTLRYRILYPDNYKARKKYPVLLFLHGSGERGSDNELQLVHGGRLFAGDSVRKKHKAIVIFPQCPKDSSWRYMRSRRDSTSMTGRAFTFIDTVPTTPARLVKGLLDSLVQNKIADRKRMYIGGLSMGGFGTFNMLEQYPGYFAAAFPICGGGNTARAAETAKTPVWIFHGDKDMSVDVQHSRAYYAALQQAGADVRYTEYPGVGHNSWDNAFAEKGLLPWVFSKKKRK